MTRKQILEKTTRDTLKNLRLNQKSTIKGLISDLEKAKREITVKLKGIKRFEMGYYRNILNGINEKIDEYTKRMNSNILSGRDYAFDLGGNLMPSIIKDVGYSYSFGKLSDELIAVSRNYTIDRIKNVGVEMKKDIAFEIRKALLKGDNTFDIARKIDSVIGVNKNFGYMNRSDVIARTEINRAYSIAKKLRDEDAVKVLPDLKRVWRTGFNPRHKDMGGGRGFISHLEVDGQIRNIGEPFFVGGEYLDYPRDMKGKPSNVINCNCHEEPYMDSWG